MVFNTFTVGAAVTPTVIETWFSHYLNRTPLHEKPTAHISYHLGLQLIRQFLTYASHHTVEDVQSFTAQGVPIPRWIRTEDLPIPEKNIVAAAEHINTQLGAKGIEEVGGPTWWQWRQEPLQAEWIEMRRDYNARRHKNDPCERAMLYIHGGAYYFGSVDEHRYQMQRHARKLQARVLAPRYRLAPQYPFPCGVLDCLAAYLYLLTVQTPDTIVLAGDSAGGGMIVAMMIILRDQGLPLPAGAILLSPWVDLTHSFPSVAGWNDFDYIPPHGFVHRASAAWPPLNVDEQKALEGLVAKGASLKELEMLDLRREAAMKAGRELSDQEQAAAQGFIAMPANGNTTSTNPLPGAATNLSITIDDTIIEIKDQIQLYAPNHLLTHPLVSPVLTPSLGGLPPLLVLVGGGEMLRDEQIYLAHKAASPATYAPSPVHLAAQGPHAADEVNKWPPTNVQLQVWDDLCHVAPTLSFTRPAKYMYRSVAQFGAWSLARAGKREVSILDDDEISIISTSSNASSPVSRETSPSRNDEAENGTNGHHQRLHRSEIDKTVQTGAIGTAGAPLPPFIAHMIRQRVTRHGVILPLDAASTLPGCTMDASEVGVIKPGPVRKWLAAQKEWGRRYAREKRAVHALRMDEIKRMADEGERFGWYGDGERPPATAIVGRLGKEARGRGVREKKKVGRWALKVWTGWGSRHDDETVEREEVKERGEETGGVSGRRVSVAPHRDVAGSENGAGFLGAELAHARPRSRSRTRSVVDEGQIAATVSPLAGGTVSRPMGNEAGTYTLGGPETLAVPRARVD